jgi:hypothetical protein
VEDGAFRQRAADDAEDFLALGSFEGQPGARTIALPSPDYTK